MGFVDEVGRAKLYQYYVSIFEWGVANRDHKPRDVGVHLLKVAMNATFNTRYLWAMSDYQVTFHENKVNLENEADYELLDSARFRSGEYFLTFVFQLHLGFIREILSSNSYPCHNI